MLHPFPDIYGQRGHRLIVADVIYSTAMAGRGYSRDGRGGITNAGGALDPDAFGELEIDAILLLSSSPGTLLVSLQGVGRAQSVFRSIRVPGVAGGAELLTASASAFNAAGAPGYAVTHWLWNGLSGAIVDGDIEFT